MNEPRLFRRGDTVKWSESLSGYPASAGWALKYRLLGATNQTAVGGNASGDGFDVELSAATTAAIPEGIYSLVGWVEKGSERYTISTVTVTVQADPTTDGSGGDTRSHVRKTLALIEAAIESYSVRPVEELSIAGRSLKRPTLGQLTALRTQYVYFVKQEEQRERSKNGSDPGGSILVKFGGVR